MEMMNLTHLNLAGRAYKGFAVLALEQFLRGQGWKKEQIPPETIRNLEKAISFLDLAIKGTAIVRVANLNKSFPSNFPAIRAYNICSTAYELSDLKRYSFDKALVHSRNLLRNILDKGDHSKKLISPEDEYLIVNFIQELGRLLPRDY